jgi:hypothetical protein
MKKDLAELLAAEAAEAEHHADAEDHGPSYRRRHPPRDPAQVYSLRIPAAQLEQLRQLAADRNVTPSALMRQWVLERVAAEQAGLPDAFQLWQRLRELLARLERADRILGRLAPPEPEPLSLDPGDEEQKDIRELITDRVMERMEAEIAQWRDERAASGAH